MTDQTYPPECPSCDSCGHTPHVMTASFQPEGENLIVGLDGKELAIPGGIVNSSIDEDGKIKVHLYANFRADAVDLISEDTGS